MGIPVIRVRIDLGYDGGGFHGFARQPDVATVQGELEGALERLLGWEVATTCAGRTDRGVHAWAQVVHLDVDADRPRAARFLRDLDDTRDRIDAMVGPAITIWAVRTVDADFDARFSATERRYRYLLADSALIDPLERHRLWHVGEALRLTPMRAGAQHLLGEHDFAAFCRTTADRHAVRRLDRITISRPSPGRLVVRLTAPAFCHQQVRSIVGCLAAVGRGDREPQWVAHVLASRDRSRAAPVAPPEALVLEGVSYGPRWPAAPPKDVRRLLGDGHRGG